MLPKAGLLKWISWTFPEPAMTRLYIHYLWPSLEYAAPVWHGSQLESKAAELEKIQSNFESCMGHLFQRSSLSPRLALAPLEKESDHYVFVS